MALVLIVIGSTLWLLASSVLGFFLIAVGLEREADE